MTDWWTQGNILWALAAGAAGFIIGALPAGYAFWRTSGQHRLLRVAVQNIGIAAVWRHAGPVNALMPPLLDLIKGAGAVALAAAAGASGGAGAKAAAASAAAAGVVIGHLYPVFTRKIILGFLPRPRGAMTSAGVIVGLSVSGLLNWWIAGAGFLIWAAMVFIPRAKDKAAGYAALGNVAAAVAVSAAAHISGHPAPVVAALYGIALLIIWRHKENLGRVADGLELRFLESRPMPGARGGEVSCAFMVHRIQEEDWWQPRRFSWVHGPLKRGWLPVEWLRRAAMALKPMQLDEITGIVTPDGRRVRVYLIGIPLDAEQIVNNEDLALKRAISGARMAEALGASIFGLGSFWSVIGGKGEKVQEAVSIPVTNGGAYTAGSVQTGVQNALERLQALKDEEAAGGAGRRAADDGRTPPPTDSGDHGTAPAPVKGERVAAVVGAAGVVGFGMARAAADASVDRLIMVGRNEERLRRLASRLARRHPEVDVVVTTSMDAVKEADLVLTATSDPDPVVFPRHVKPGAIVYDMGRPIDVHPSVATDVPGVTLLPGGVVRPPGAMEGRIDLHFGDGHIPACMAETIMLALTGEYGHRSLGERTRSASIEYFVRTAGELGFQPADNIAGT